jgi:hypothetical protein
LFSWWIWSITFNVAFVIAASIYLYTRRKRPHKEQLTGIGKVVRVLKDFVFVWVLSGLLIFYVYAVGVASASLFAAGNVVVEVLLVVYQLKVGKSSEAQQT